MEDEDEDEDEDDDEDEDEDEEEEVGGKPYAALAASLAAFFCACFLV